MANMQPFSLKIFRETFSRSRAKQFMSNMELAQIHTALEEKNEALLGKLYKILIQEQVNDEKLVRDFIMTKNRLVDGFEVEAISIEKQYVEAPRKKRAAKAEKTEQQEAEKLLGNL